MPARHAAPMPIRGLGDDGASGWRELRWESGLADADVAVLIIYFYQGETTLDVDNIAKSLLDALKGVLFRDDKQVSELLIRKSRLSAGFSLTGASPYLLDAIERMTKAGSDFVYIRIDEAPDHSRIP
ncbi:MAG: RusA family crossover junction endodeoxyribonuclease [Stellaceae bacterium]